MQTEQWLRSTPVGWWLVGGWKTTLHILGIWIKWKWNWFGHLQDTLILIEHDRTLRSLPRQWTNPPSTRPAGKIHGPPDMFQLTNANSFSPGSWQKVATKTLQHRKPRMELMTVFPEWPFFSFSFRQKVMVCWCSPAGCTSKRMSAGRHSESSIGRMLSSCHPALSNQGID